MLKQPLFKSDQLSGRRWLNLTLLVVVLILVVSIPLYVLYIKNKIEAHAFVGSIQNIKDSKTIIVEGLFDTKDRPDLFIPNNIRNVEVQITSKTRIIKVYILIPIKEELDKTGGVFYPEKLPKEERPITLEILKNEFQYGRGEVMITASSNIFNKLKFKAEEIRLHVFSYPGDDIPSK